MSGTKVRNVMHSFSVKSFARSVILDHSTKCKAQQSHALQAFNASACQTESIIQILFVLAIRWLKIILHSNLWLIAQNPHETDKYTESVNSFTPSHAAQLQFPHRKPPHRLKKGKRERIATQMLLRSL